MQTVKFGTATYLKNDYVARGNWSLGTSRAAIDELVDQMERSKGLRAERLEWDGHPFALTGKQLRTVDAARQDFDRAVEILRKHVFEGRRYYVNNVPKKTEELALELSQTAIRARATVMGILKKAQVFVNADDIRLRVVQKLDNATGQNLLNKVVGQ